MIQNRNHLNQRLRNLLRKKLTMIPARAVAYLRQIRRTTKVVINSILLLIIGHVATFYPATIMKIWPKWSNEKKDWFWSPWFKMEIERYWYLKNASDYLLALITYYILAKVANKFSTSLFLACLIFFGYHVIDFFMFWWDFNGNYYVYVDLLWTAIMLIKYALFPFKEERLAKIRSFF